MRHGIAPDQMLRQNRRISVTPPRRGSRVAGMRLHSFSRAASIAGAVLLTASLAACGGDDDRSGGSAPETTAAATSAASAEPAEPTARDADVDPTPTPSGNPTAADGTELVPLIDTVTQPVAPEMTKDDAGAFAFTTYALDVLNYAYATGDSATLHEIYDPAAGHLATVTGAVDQIVPGGLTQYGGAGYMDMTEMMTVSWPSEDVAEVQFTLIYEPGVVLDANGEVLHTSDGGSREIVYELEWRDGGWVNLDATQA